ncbi:hypothetical protein [Frankia sp. CiP3]|uniref:hypothetical protein n=1 Tax=Frankia sp. CiP3 TaxID=2880971 RepID=UPI001EF5D56F|nr:hypothetical protein [Frankia sp. CiP3]
MTDRGSRAEAEWRNQVGSLRSELGLWQAETAHGRPLEKHHSQVRSIATMLESCAGKTAAWGWNPHLSARDRQEIILDLHHIWDFFRAKLALRLVDWYREFLVAADEFAWACYAPAVANRADRLGTAAVEEPPLVFLNRLRTPFAQLRGDAFLELGMSSEQARTWPRLIPFPMIGIPWYTTRHLPDLLYIGHEVGHHLEDRLELADSLRERLGNAGVDEAWSLWLSEVFADICGCLFAGEMYAATLFDALANTCEVTRDYPPPPLRAQVCISAVEWIRGHDVALMLKREWQGPKPSPRQSAEADKVVDFLLKGSYEQLDGRCLTGLLGLGADYFDSTHEQAGLLLAGLTPDVGDTRAIIVAATAAFRTNPDLFDRCGSAARALRKVRSLVPKGIRDTSSDAHDTDSRHARTAGDEIFQLIANRRRLTAGSG